MPYNHGIRTAGGGFLYSAVERLVNLALYLAAARERRQRRGYSRRGHRAMRPTRPMRPSSASSSATRTTCAPPVRDLDRRRERGPLPARPLRHLRRPARPHRTTKRPPCSAAASALLDDPSFPFSDDLRLAMAKIASAIDSGDVPAAARLADEEPEPPGAVVAQLADAAGPRKSVDFGYTNSRGISAPHAVEPYGLFLHDGRWYLVGRDTRQDELAHLHRGAHVGHRRSNPPAPSRPTSSGRDGFDVASFVRLPFQYGPADPEFEARFASSPALCGATVSLSAGQGCNRDGCRRGSCWRVAGAFSVASAAVRDRQRPGTATRQSPRCRLRFAAALRRCSSRHG